MHDRMRYEVSHRTQNIVQISIAAFGLLDGAVQKIGAKLLARHSFRRPQLEKVVLHPAL
jgi:hypothetical protein